MEGVEINAAIQNAKTVISFVFSAIMVAPICVIVSGHLLYLVMPINIQGSNSFQINLYFFQLHAEKGQFVLGFAGMFSIFFIISAINGEAVYTHFSRHMGFDLGQAPTLITVCSLILVFISLLIAVLFRGRGAFTETSIRDSVHLRVKNALARESGIGKKHDETGADQ